MLTAFTSFYCRCLTAVFLRIFVCLLPQPPPRSTLFPYTTLFRSTSAIVAELRVASTASTASVSSTMSISDSRIDMRSEEHTSELQSRGHLVCRLLLEKKKERNRSKYFDAARRIGTCSWIHYKLLS